MAQVFDAGAANGGAAAGRSVHGTFINSEVIDSEVIDSEVIDSEVIDEGVFRRLLRRAGRTIARPALEALELVLDPGTPPQVRFTMVAALTYLLLPTDLIPDLLPVAGFSDDLVALTALISLHSNHVSDAIRQRAQRKLDRWFPNGRP
ncbi:MAG: hypothetical protein RLZZ216_1958 [Cyanobacteriota bacterium]|jgi:uncharacterized membrane protein YkvA (DUF1232 family)